MSYEWGDMLDKAGIMPAVDTANHIGEQLGNGPQLVELSHMSVVDITGEDASSFLQGQFSNDLLQVSETQAQVTGYCSPKGRLLALPLIIGTGEGYRLLLPASVKDAFLKRLGMFVMRAAVTLTERPDLACLGLQAENAGSIDALPDELGALPLAPMDSASSDEQQLVRWHDAAMGESLPRYLLVAGMDRIQEIWTQSSLTKNNNLLWRLGDISAGIPSITSGVTESFVPQMINLQLIDALSFTKGCYPGQEIVARMQYLGKLKRHMCLFHMGADATTAPAAGDKLTSGTDQEAGIVVDAVQYSDQYTAILAVTKVSADDSTLQFNGQALTMKELPYTLPTQEDSPPSED